MTPHRILNWLAATLIALAMSMAYLLDGPSELQARVDTTRAVIAAAQADQERDRFAMAAQNLCGQNAAWRLVAADTVQCYTNRGHKTHTVQVTL